MRANSARMCYGIKGMRDPVTFKRVYKPDPETKIPVKFFGPGYPYKFLGMFQTNIHLISVEGAEAEKSLFLLGTDIQGRDVWSRLMYGTQTSLTIGLVSVALSLVLGVLLGGISGFYGGTIDTMIQRMVEILRSVPTIPLWMGLAAALPASWSVTQVYFAITMIISLLGWTELARVVRGTLPFAARRGFRDGGRVGRLQPAAHHFPPHGALLPQPHHRLHHPGPARDDHQRNLAELSGLGLRPPAISWGVLLQDAQNVQALAISPWLLIPVLPVILAVLAFNFTGDGLRDAADPYG